MVVKSYTRPQNMIIHGSSGRQRPSAERVGSTADPAITHTDTQMVVYAKTSPANAIGRWGSTPILSNHAILASSAASSSTCSPPPSAAPPCAVCCSASSVAAASLETLALWKRAISEAGVVAQCGLRPETRPRARSLARVLPGISSTFTPTPKCTPHADAHAACSIACSNGQCIEHRIARTHAHANQHASSERANEPNVRHRYRQPRQLHPCARADRRDVPTCLLSRE